MKPWPPHLYLQAGAANPETAARALSQALLVGRTNPRLPAILTLRHLSELSSVGYKFLRAVVARRESAHPYLEFFIAKKNGSKRRICVPRPPLLRAQQWINRYILRLLPRHPASFAYSPGTSAVDCARIHCGAKWMIKIDIKDFFESISEIQAYRVFHGLGYQPLVAFELARICTYMPVKSSKSMYSEQILRTNPRATSKIAGYKQEKLGVLPQGAPTSPMLSNAVLRAFDDKVYDLAGRFGAVYTRYSDDLVFSSSSTDFSRSRASALIAGIFNQMRQVGLHPNETKTRVLPPGARKIVLGLQVDSAMPRLRREFRDQLERHIYFINRVGPLHHCQHLGFHSVLGFKLHLLGLLNYARQVEPAFAQPLIEAFDAAQWPL